jgi:hypothetical protein
LALQAKLKGKERATQSSKDDDSSDNEDDELDDEQMAFFINNFICAWVMSHPVS